MPAPHITGGYHRWHTLQAGGVSQRATGEDAGIRGEDGLRGADSSHIQANKGGTNL